MIGARRYRSHTCVGAADALGERVRVSGWVHRRRDHGGVVFIDLRDRSGIVQLVFHPTDAPSGERDAGSLSAEDVICVDGEVVARSPQTVNPSIPTGGTAAVRSWEACPTWAESSRRRSSTRSSSRCRASSST